MEKALSSHQSAELLEEQRNKRPEAKSAKEKIAAAIAAVALTVGPSAAAIAQERERPGVKEEKESALTMDIPSAFCEGGQASMFVLGAELVGQDGNTYYFPPEKCKTGYLSAKTLSTASADPEKGYPPQVELECDFTANRANKSLTAQCGPKDAPTKPFIGIASLQCELGTGAVVADKAGYHQLPVVVACRGEGGHGYRGDFSADESKEGRPHELELPLRKVDLLDPTNEDNFMRRDVEVVLKHTLPEKEKPSAVDKVEKSTPPSADKKGKKQ